MANALYPKAKEAFITKLIDMSGDTIKVALVSAAYTYSAAHQFLSDITGRQGTDQTLGSKTVASGVFNAAASTWTAITGSACVAVVLYQDTGVAGTSRLIAFLDTGFTGSPGIPVTPNGGNIVVTWNASGIFAL